MAKKGNRMIIRLSNKQTGTFYTMTKNRINNKEKIKLKKYDPKTKKHELFEETKAN